MWQFSQIIIILILTKNRICANNQFMFRMIVTQNVIFTPARRDATQKMSLLYSIKREFLQIGNSHSVSMSYCFIRRLQI